MSATTLTVTTHNYLCFGHMTGTCTSPSEYPLGERIQKCAHRTTHDEAGTKMENTAPWGHGGGTGVFLKWMVSARVRARAIRYKPSHVNCHSMNDNGLRFAASETKRRV
jgi:hypothetical protein